MSHGTSHALSDPDRLATLTDAGLLDTPPEEVFDRLAALARSILNAPTAMVTLVDANRQFFKSCLGLPEPWRTRRESPLSHSFCQHTVARRTPLVIEDARRHPLVQESRAITEMGMVSYLGAPLITHNGQALGTLCVADTQPRAWSDADVATVTELARCAITQIELRRLLRDMQGQQEARLAEERQRLLKQLALGLRHEINNALASILLMTELLDMPDAPPEERARRVEVIQLEAVRIRDVVNRLEDVGVLRTRDYPTGQTMVDLS